MRTLYLVSKRLPRVCMGGSTSDNNSDNNPSSAPRVHGWFRELIDGEEVVLVCPACAWVVPSLYSALPYSFVSAPRVHGWFAGAGFYIKGTKVCPACAWVVPGRELYGQPSSRLPRVCMGGS